MLITRDTFLTTLRGQKLGVDTAQTLSGELFQNEVLRPILKLQNEVFLASFANYVTKYKGDFYSLSIKEKLIAIEISIQKDIKYRNSLQGMIVGLFTLDEFTFYLKNASALNKRMIGMLIERLKSQVDMLDIYLKF